MRTLLQLVAEFLWPVRAIPPPGRVSRDVYLRPLVLLIIVLLVGPELFAVVELTTLLDLLGATMFLFAFAVAYKMLGVALLKWLLRALVPGECVTLMKTRAPSAVGLGLALISVNGLLLCLVCFLPYVGFELLLQKL
jgi:hypothetical protein